MSASRRRQRLGQHFLHEQGVLDRIADAADLRPTDTVLEIGPGLGALTRRIAPLCGRLVAVELDPQMIEELSRRGLPATVEIVHADAATLDYASLGPLDAVVANLPYSASSPITFRLLRVPFRRAVLMYQLEFAHRLVAKPGTPDYGRLAAACAYFANARILQRVGRGAFSPPPDVDSAIVILEPHPAPPFPVHSPDTYLELLRVLFSTRRKTLRATLKRQAPELQVEPVHAEACLLKLGVSDQRPEELAPPQLGALDAALHEAPHA